MPSFRNTAALTSAALLALALSLALARSLKAQCPPPGGYRYTYAGIERFNGVRTTRTHLQPDYGPAVPTSCRQMRFCRRCNEQESGPVVHKCGEWAKSETHGEVCHCAFQCRQEQRR